MENEANTKAGECDVCQAPLNRWRTCPLCGVSHSGAPCAECNRRGYHKAGCSRVGGDADSPLPKARPAIASLDDGIPYEAFMLEGAKMPAFAPDVALELCIKFGNEPLEDPHDAMLLKLDDAGTVSTLRAVDAVTVDGRRRMLWKIDEADAQAWAWTIREGTEARR